LVFVSSFAMKAADAGESNQAPPASLPVTGIVKDVVTKMPIPSAQIFVDGDCGASNVFSGADGQFTLENLELGRHLVTADVDGGAYSGSRYVDVKAVADPDESPPVVWIEVRSPVTLSGATAGRPYRYKLGVAGSNMVRFRRIDGAPWLNITTDGYVEGTPPNDAAEQSVIHVQVCAAGKTPKEGFFVVPVQRISCPPTSPLQLDWCERDPNVERVTNATFKFSEQARVNLPIGEWGDVPQIIQFSRVQGEHGRFANLDPELSKLTHVEDALQVAPSLVSTVNASKVFISGSILVKHGVKNCSDYQWKVVTESIDSSNILVYGPTELNFFCDQQTLLIVLPVHAIWANVIGSHANTYDPSWKPLGSPPRGHECKGNDPLAIDGIPSQGIRPCDDLHTTPLTGPFYWPYLAGMYNRLTQPGASQGTISLAPRGISPKGAWDAQGYISTQFGPGWIGINTVYEHDHKMQDDLNSLTSALTYDLRLGPSQSFWSSAKPDCPDFKCPLDPVVGLRTPELTLRFGPEWSPGSAAIKVKPPEKNYNQDLNMVGAATLRLPIIVNFNKTPSRLFDKQPQPSMITIQPLVGTEEGFRVRSHEVGQKLPQPQEITRFVIGGDASLRLPFTLSHNFLGDKPITLEYSFRARALAHDEPYIDTRSETESLSESWRYYSRMTLIMPFSAYLQVRVALQRGSLPPLFQAVGSFLTVGVTFSNPGSSEH
jgi:hypothetical protein